MMIITAGIKKKKCKLQVLTYRIGLFLNSGYAVRESIYYNKRVLAQLSRPGDIERRKGNGREL